MKNLLALIGLVAIAVYVLKIDPSNILRMLQLPGFNLPGQQQQTQQQPQTPQPENQLPQTPQVDQTPQTPQAIQTPQATPAPGKNQWGIGFKGAITTPFGATKNEASLGNPDFTENNENNQSE